MAGITQMEIPKVLWEGMKEWFDCPYEPFVGPPNYTRVYRTNPLFGIFRLRS